MQVIGFQFTSSNSGQNRHHTTLIFESGVILTHWGGRNYVNGRYEESRGNVKSDTIPMTKSTLRGALQKAWDDKFNRDFDGITFDFNGIDYPGVDENTTDLTYQTMTRDIAKDWLEAVRTNFPNQADQPKATKRNLSDEFAAIEAFAENANKGIKSAYSTSGAKNKTAKPAAAPVDKKFIEIDEIKAGKPILRPNGEEYKPREVMGHYDIALMRQFRKTTTYFRLSGPPGAGKTAAVEAAFGDDLITVSGHGDMTVSNFVGTHLPRPDGTWEWVDGPLVKAMREGKPLFVDEGTRIPSEVLNILFSVMDGRNQLRLDDRPDDPIVNAKEGFFVVMGYNPDTLGARRLDEALVSRFRIQIEVKTDKATAKALRVPPLALKIAANLETRDKKNREEGGLGIWVPQMRELLTFRDLVEQGVGEDFALATLLASCPEPSHLEEVHKAILFVSKAKEVNIPSLGNAI